MMKQTFWLMSLGLALSCTSQVKAAAPSLVDYSTQQKAEQSKYQRPEDLLDMIPFFGEIPRTFLIGDGFKMKLSADSLRIDHMGHRSRTPAHKRTCMVGLSYTTPVAFFTTRVDLPLLSAANLQDTWEVATLGDYVAYFSRTPAASASFKLVATARF